MGKPLRHFPVLRNEMFGEAVFHGREEVVQMVLDSGLNINTALRRGGKTYVSALDVAASRGDIRIVQFLLDRGASAGPLSPMMSTSTPLQNAACGGHQEVVEILLERGAIDGRILGAAVDRGQARLVKWLLAKDPSQITRRHEHQRHPAGVNALFRAIQISNLDIITLLVDASVSLEGTYDGESLMRDVVISSAWVADFLLSLGVIHLDPEKYESYQWAPEDDIKSQRVEEGVAISRRTWQWIGKH
ncbi:ankyrin repeat-containing domain protein [Daldinia grandis]|nr:ankyrin repeat-containing domain protein [Daldinia grandis]